jgi:hypothetical protein
MPYWHPFPEGEQIAQRQESALRGLSVPQLSFALAQKTSSQKISCYLHPLNGSLL